jgi:hypothetical protein
MADAGVSEHPIDRLSDLELLQALVAFFGMRRTTELLGWSAMAALCAWPKSPVEFRQELEACGLKKSAMYDALVDIRRFGRYLQEQEGRVPAPDSPMDGMVLLKKLRRLNAV